MLNLSDDMKALITVGIRSALESNPFLCADWQDGDKKSLSWLQGAVSSYIQTRDFLKETSYPSEAWWDSFDNEVMTQATHWGK